MKRRTLEELAAEAAAKAEALNAKLAMQKLLARDANVRRARRISRDLEEFIKDYSVPHGLTAQIQAVSAGVSDWVAEKARV